MHMNKQEIADYFGKNITSNQCLIFFHEETFTFSREWAQIVIYKIYYEAVVAYYFWCYGRFLPVSRHDPL